MSDDQQVQSIRAFVKGAVPTGHMPYEEEFDAKDELYPLIYPHAGEYEVRGDEMKWYYYRPWGGEGVTWLISGELYRELEAGNMTISDAYEIVTFTDGTVEVHPIDLIFNEDGSVYDLYPGMTAAAYPDPTS